MSDAATPELRNLYARAFRDFGALALWSMRAVDDPAPEDALAIAPALRTHGGMVGRRLAEAIEAACRAAD